jgi:hypothetical protein
LWKIAQVAQNHPKFVKNHPKSPKIQRSILNITPGPQGWTSPLEVNSAHRGGICPVGGMFTPSFTHMGEHSLPFRRMEGRT